MSCCLYIVWILVLFNEFMSKHMSVSNGEFSKAVFPFLYLDMIHYVLLYINI